MVQTFKSIALAGAFTLVAVPAFAYDFNLNPLGLELDPFHILTPPPPAPPMVAPEPAPMVMPAHRHHHMKHHKKPT